MLTNENLCFRLHTLHSSVGLIFHIRDERAGVLGRVWLPSELYHLIRCATWGASGLVFLGWKGPNNRWPFPDWYDKLMGWGSGRAMMIRRDIIVLLHHHKKLSCCIICYSWAHSVHSHSLSRTALCSATFWANGLFLKNSITFGSFLTKIYKCYLYRFLSGYNSKSDICPEYILQTCFDTFLFMLFWCSE